MPSLIDILLVEDNPGDIRLALDTLHSCKMQNSVHVVTNGRDAMRYLRGESPYAQRRLPDMIILDLNLPEMDGLEVLEEMRAEPRLSTLPVVILTGSKADGELLRKFDISTDCFIQKPLTLERYLEAIRCFPQFGLSIIRVAEA